MWHKRQIAVCIAGVLCFSNLVLAEQAPAPDPNAGSSSSDNLEKRFEKLYAEWRVARYGPVDLSSPQSFSSVRASSERRALVKLGPASIPLVLQKLSESPELVNALCHITGRALRYEDFPAGNDSTTERVKMFKKWWYTERGKTPEIFEKRYAAWLKIRNSGTEKEIFDADMAISKMGYDIIPLLLKKIKANANDEAALYMFDRVVFGRQVEITTDAESVLRWWDANKEMYILPPSKPVLTGSKNIEELYSAWVQAIQRPEYSLSSNINHYMSEPHYKKMLECDQSVLPFLINKMQISQGLNRDLLYSAIYHISKLEQMPESEFYEWQKRVANNPNLRRLYFNTDADKMLWLKYHPEDYEFWAKRGYKPADFELDNMKFDTKLSSKTLEE